MNNISTLYIIILVITGMLMPIMGIVNGPKVKLLLDTSPEKRISIYVQTIVMLTLLAGLVLISMFIKKDPLTEIGAGFLTDIKLLSVLVALCLGFLLIVYRVQLKTNLLNKLKQSYQNVMYLIPETGREYRAGVLMSFVAGFSEEIVFRGFLFHQLLAFIPTTVALLLVNIIFGLCHWGTGYKNAFWSFVLGLSWSIMYLLTDSLWLPIMIHVMIDLYSMSIGYRINSQDTPTLITKSDQPAHEHN